MKKLRVLMLGWEFPPIINGGLGIACLGLSKALSSRVNLSVILPKSDPHYTLDQVELIGLNHIEVEKLKQSETSVFYQDFASVQEVAISGIDPYRYGSTSTQIYPLQGELKTSVKKEPLPGYRFQIEDLYGEDKIQKVIEFAKYTASLAMNANFDIIHAHDWMTFLAGIEIKARTGKPLVLHVHSLEHDRSSPESRNWVYYTEKWAMEYADAILPVSKYTGHIATDHYGISPEKIHPVHNGCDSIYTYKKAKPFPESLVLFIGRVTNQKGPQYFLDIAERVLAKMPQVRFTMAGTGDQLRQLIETGAYRHMGNKFHFTGFLDREKINDLLSMADVYCMPSVSEPFGLSALEAAQFGVPCVISRQSGVAEVLNSALKAEFWDTQKMAEHIIDLLQYPTLRNNIVHNAYQDLKQCSWEKAADTTVNIYHDLVR